LFAPSTEAARRRRHAELSQRAAQLTPAEAAEMNALDAEFGQTTLDFDDSRLSPEEAARERGRDAIRAKMRERASERLRAADLRMQTDMFGEPGQMDLFGSPPVRVDDSESEWQPF